MPASHRTQVLLPERIAAEVGRLAKKRKRSVSAMCAELIEFALTHGEEFRDLGREAFKEETTQALVNGAMLDDVRMQKLLKLLDAIE